MKTSLILLLAALTVTGCTLHAVAGDYRLNASITRDSDALPLSERTPTAEYMTPVILPTNTPTPEPGCIVTAQGWLNVRAVPNGTVVGKVNQGARVIVVREQGDWAQIEAPPGWVAGWLLACDE